MLLSIGSLSLFAQKQNLYIIYIGDSITAGAGLSDPDTQAPPVIASAYLQKQDSVGAVEFSNQGHSGFTTVDFLPSGIPFSKVEDAANTFKDKPGLLIFSIMLGTNDSAIKGPNGAPVAPGTYSNNFKAIIDRLVTDYPKCKVIIHRPIWYSPNTYNGAKYLLEGLNRLQSYFPATGKLVKDYAGTNKGQVFIGDTQAFLILKENSPSVYQAENGHQGIFYLHPNETGAAALGTYWAKAIYKIISSN
ncbi:MAG: lipolytic protein family [Mucilaginibacter sp.]|nr:lipolytic protein family [Mucilaginibacter sp.]